MSLSFAELKPHQAMVVSMLLKHRKLLLQLPRQEGKTEIGLRMIRDVIASPDKFRQCLFLAKSKPAARKATTEKFFRLFDKTIFDVNTERVYQKKNNTACCYIDSVDKDPDKIRGGTYHFIHWSEVAFSKLELGVKVTDIVGKILKPTLRTTKGYVFAESTNNGRNGWYDLWQNADEWGFKTLKLSLSDLVYLGCVAQDEYDAIERETHPDIFRQEYECDWVTFSGLVYPEFRFEKHVWADMPMPKKWQLVVCGIDWGYRDGTCLLAAYVVDGMFCIFDEIYCTETLIDVFAAQVHQHWQEWHVDRVTSVADHEPDRIEELHKRGIPCANAEKTNVLGCRIELKEAFWKHQIRIHPRCVTLIRELQTIAWHPTKTDEIDPTGCTWGHYDAEAALRYLFRELRHVEADVPPSNPMTDSIMSASEHELRRIRNGL